MSLLAELELAEWTVRHLRLQSLLGMTVLHAARNREGPGFEGRLRARIEADEQKTWEHLIDDKWLPESKCNPDLPEEELRRALASDVEQIPLLQQEVVRSDAKLRKYNVPWHW